MERTVIQVFRSLSRTFFSTKSFHKMNESSNVYAAETLCKNYNIARRYAVFFFLIAVFQDVLLIARNILIFLLEITGVLINNSKITIASDIDFGVSRIKSRFTEYDTKSATRGIGKDKKIMQRASREVTSNIQETKEIG